MKKLLIIPMIFFLFACAKEQTIDPNLRFFDLDKFIAKSLEDRPNRKVEMLVETNGENETRIIEDYDMTKALEYLKEFNINKAKWHDKYKVETGANLERYEAIDESMKVREMIIHKSGDAIVSIEIDYLNETIISDMTKKIYWQIDRELKINNASKSLLGKESELKMAWKW